jgi:hypothetical protein
MFVGNVEEVDLILPGKEIAKKRFCQNVEINKTKVSDT